MNKPNTFATLRKLWNHFSPNRKKQYFFLILIMLISSLVELVSLGSIIPFLAVISNPEILFSNPAFNYFINFFGILKHNQVVYYLAVFFGFFAIFSGLMKLFLLYLNNQISFETGAELGIDLYKRALYQPYSIHISRNTSQIIDLITSKTNQVTLGVILPSLIIINSFIIMVILLVALFFVNSQACLYTSLAIGVTYLVIIKITRNKKIQNSQIIAENSSNILKNVREGLGCIRDTLINESFHFYLDNFKNLNSNLRKAQKSNQFLSLSPRYILEALILCSIAFLISYLFFSEQTKLTILPLLAFLALSAQRLLPLMQQSYTSWSSIEGSYRSLYDIVSFLEQPVKENEKETNRSKLKFHKDIVIRNVNFNYPAQSKNTLKKISLTISKGDIFGIIGATGSGKTTLVDIITGLLEPISGEIEVDGIAINKNNIHSWRKHIAYVPQDIYLADVSIAENIALGIRANDINFSKVKICAKKAHLDKVIENLPLGYKTIVGERGVNFSGGQRQRIAIARALYNDTDILIFDEATSALDSQTENLVMQCINSISKNVTIIIISHKLSALKNCTKIIEISDGKIIKKLKYKDL